MQPTENSEAPKSKRQKLSPEEFDKRRKESNDRSRAKLLARDPDYFKRYQKAREEAIKAGTWNPRRKKAGQVLPEASPCSTEPPIAA